MADTSTPTMLEDYPYKFNSTAIIFPTQWNETFNTIETVQQSEAGTDMINVTRYKKLSVSVSTRVSSTWRKTFEEFASLDTFTLSRYDVITSTYVTHTVRMRNFSASKVKGSEDLLGATSWGTYDVSFNLEEI